VSSSFFFAILGKHVARDDGGSHGGPQLLRMKENKKLEITNLIH
jgi:hypothetical protein